MSLDNLVSIESVQMSFSAEVTPERREMYRLNQIQDEKWYLALGFTGMQDGIVLVNDVGAVVELTFYPQDYAD